MRVEEHHPRHSIKLHLFVVTQKSKVLRSAIVVRSTVPTATPAQKTARFQQDAETVLLRVRMAKNVTTEGITAPGLQLVCAAPIAKLPIVAMALSKRLSESNVTKAVAMVCLEEPVIVAANCQTVAMVLYRRVKCVTILHKRGSVERAPVRVRPTVASPTAEMVCWISGSIKLLHQID